MKPLIAAALAALLPWQALAAPYGAIDPERSSIRFHYSQMGVAMDGEFERFEAKLDFDPDSPEEGRAVVEVFLDSIQTGTDEGDDEVRGRDWLDADGHPAARFETSAIKALGDGRFEATGTLDIKGTSREVAVPVTFAERDGLGVFEGRFSLVRGDYAVGEGAWAATDVVAADVGVSFSLAARPAP